jgi:hypothetical protein
MQYLKRRGLVRKAGEALNGPHEITSEGRRVLGEMMRRAGWSRGDVHAAQTHDIPVRSVLQPAGGEDAATSALAGASGRNAPGAAEADGLPEPTIQPSVRSSRKFYSFADSIARQKRIKLPPGYTNSGSISRAFLDHHAPKKTGGETAGEHGLKPRKPSPPVHRSSRSH